METRLVERMPIRTDATRAFILPSRLSRDVYLVRNHATYGMYQAADELFRFIGGEIFVRESFGTQISSWL